ncbi:conserved hypothetical protein [Hyella patelloides LEGE 07179]|uniref:Uncharacterized protein n=1 Tax=Hyella patelloides LEGE 07179 TaxID=945734 RepID=A0A563VYA5_9CYAN|nr:hypothetical protein [Hyella patelloides]VEP16263.1 conserved hypothetical protein [Hyella patelloides LEGE 07179]
MKGLSITAIGLRSIADCLDIFKTLENSLQLDFLELAIGSNCDVNFNYQNTNLILHDSCLYQGYFRCKLDPFRPKSWYDYAKFIDNNYVIAVSLHPPLRKYCSQKDLEMALVKMQDALKVPVYLEVMPSSEYWCSSFQSLVNFPLLLDVSHVNIWHQGNSIQTKKTCLSLLQSSQVGAIHLSHNAGKADTHDLIPQNIWFQDYIEQWSEDYLVTYESLPIEYAMYERLDKPRKRKIK